MQSFPHKDCLKKQLNTTRSSPLCFIFKKIFSHAWDGKEQNLHTYADKNKACCNLINKFLLFFYDKKWHKIFFIVPQEKRITVLIKLKDIHKTH